MNLSDLTTIRDDQQFALVKIDYDRVVVMRLARVESFVQTLRAGMCKTEYRPYPQGDALTHHTEEKITIEVVTGEELRKRFQPSDQTQPANDDSSADGPAVADAQPF